MNQMFCFQCEQTAGGKGCRKVGVCGKQPEVANLQDELTCALVGLARAARGQNPGQTADDLMMRGLFATITNVNFDAERIKEMIHLVRREQENLGGAEEPEPASLWQGDPDMVSLRSLLLLGQGGWPPTPGTPLCLEREIPKLPTGSIKECKTSARSTPSISG